MTYEHTQSNIHLSDEEISCYIKKMPVHTLLSPPQSPVININSSSVALHPSYFFNFRLFICRPVQLAAKQTAIERVSEFASFFHRPPILKGTAVYWLGRPFVPESDGSCWPRSSFYTGSNRTQKGHLGEKPRNWPRTLGRGCAIYPVKAPCPLISTSPLRPLVNWNSDSQGRGGGVLTHWSGYGFGLE